MHRFVRVEVVASDQSTGNPSSGGDMSRLTQPGKWIIVFTEEVEVDFPEQAFEAAERQVKEREGILEATATGLAIGPLEPYREFRGV